MRCGIIIILSLLYCYTPIPQNTNTDITLIVTVE